MSRVLVLFLDGVGLGRDDPEINPLAKANLPALSALLSGHRLVEGTAPFEGELASLVAIDARMGVPGTPQSATGQAALLTGRNVSAEVGEHYGPKPNAAVAAILRERNLFSDVVRGGGTAALLNAYPPRYFESIESGRRLYSSIPLAATAAGLELMTSKDLQESRALSADFTGAGWSAQPDFPPASIETPESAGRHLARLAEAYDLTWFDYWLSDYAGHRAEMEQAVQLLESIDAVLGGLAEAWRRREDLVVITSDHGNLENLSRKGHTMNDVPGLVLGPVEPRRAFLEGLRSLADFAPAIRAAIFGPVSP